MKNIKDIKRMKANFAYQRILKVEELADKTNYKSHVKNTPMYIYKNGLLATIAFILTKKNDKAYHELLMGIVDYINKDYDYIVMNEQFKDGKELIEYLSNLDKCPQQTYRRIQLSVLSMFEWLVKFSDGMIV